MFLLFDKKVEFNQIQLVGSFFFASSVAARVRLVAQHVASFRLGDQRQRANIGLCWMYISARDGELLSVRCALFTKLERFKIRTHTVPYMGVG